MLTAEQIAAFHRDGFLVIRGVFKGRELEELRKAADGVVAEGLAKKAPHHQYHKIDGQEVYYRSERMFERDPIFRASAVHPALLEAIGQCTGHPFLPINDSFVCKIPRGNVPIHWHQDPPYGFWKDASKTTFEVPNFDTDIYLDASTIENGCVWGIPGYHLVGQVDMSKFSQEELFEKFGATPLIMEPGDVLFHGISGPHGSVGNKTDTIRRIYYVHYMPREVLEHDYGKGFLNDSRGRGFNPHWRGKVNEMIEARKEMGFGGIEGAKIKFDDAGFTFTGQPTSPPRVWRALIDAIPEETKNKMRKLELKA
jgi:ectoine hydroxylase-related dioxygenase (phytanoyl-CoA dioxygenase family)